MSNNNHTTQTIEYALSMYKETVSPPQEDLIRILTQIPEKKELQVPLRRVTRSPYIWVTVAELITLCSLIFAVYPSYQDALAHADDPFYQVDKQVSQFENKIDQEDLQLASDDIILI